jgi:MFS family permease
MKPQTIPSRAGDAEGTELQAGSQNRSPHTRTALTVLGICLLLNLIGRGTADTYVVFLLPLERDLGWTRSEMTSVYSIYLLVNGLTAPIAGILFDRLGPRVVYGCGMAGLAAAYLFASQVQTLWQYYATVGAITGVSVAALGMVPSSSLISRWFLERMSTAISIAFAGLGLGALLIVPSVQYLLQRHGWRDSYQMLGLTLLCLVPLVLLLPWQRYRDGHPGYRHARKPGAAEAKDWTVRAATRTRLFWGLVWVFFFTSIGMYSVTVQTVVYLVEQGFPAIVAATAFGFASMLSVFGIVGTGAIADRFGPRRTVSVTFVGSISGVLILLLMTWFPQQGWLVAYVILFGLCQGARGPIISSMSTRLFAGSQVASIYGVIYASNAFGAGLGALIAGLLHDFTGGYRAGFVVSVCALLLAVLPFWRVPEMRDFHMRERSRH